MSSKDACFIRVLRLVRYAANVLVVIGVTAASVGYQIAEQQAALASQMNHWETTDGRVVRSDIRQTDVADGRATVYSPDVLVEYSVGDERFSTDRVFRCSRSELTSANRGDVENVVKSFSAAAAVPVFYDLRDPSRGVLSREMFSGFGQLHSVRLNPVGVLIAGIGLAVVGLVLVRLVSSVVGTILRKYEAFAGDPSRMTMSALQEFYPGLESAKFFQFR